MAQHEPPRTTELGAFEEMSEADRAEQATPAYPDDAPYSDVDPRSVPDDRPVPDAAVPVADIRDTWEADPADMAEQAIAVPLGDDYDGAYADDEP
ncbi:hypothetical protein [Nocardia sp. NPDC003345]